MIHLLSKKAQKLILYMILGVCILSSIITNTTAQPPDKRWHGTTEHFYQLQNIIIDTLKKVRHDTLKLPPFFAKPIQKKIDLIEKKIQHTSLLYNTTNTLQLLSWILDRTQQIHLFYPTQNHSSFYYISLGYLAFYKLHTDGKKAEIWNETTKKWQLLPAKAAHKLKVLWRMENDYQPPEILNLPYILAEEHTASNVPYYQYPLFSHTHKESIFSTKDTNYIMDELLEIEANLKNSTLQLFFPEINVSQYNGLSVPLLKEVFTMLQSLFHRSQHLSYIHFPRTFFPKQHAQYSAIVGAFSIVGSNDFYTMDENTSLLSKRKTILSDSFNIHTTLQHQKDNIVYLPIDLHDLQYRSLPPISITWTTHWNPPKWFIRILYIISLLSLAGIIFHIGLTLQQYSNLKKQYKNRNQYQNNNILGQLILNAQHEKKEKWINVMHNHLFKEKANQKKIEKRITKMIFFVITMSFFLLLHLLFKFFSASSISSLVLIKLLVPLVISCAFCIILLFGQAALITIHRHFLIKLEDCSWNLLFESEKH